MSIYNSICLLTFGYHVDRVTSYRREALGSAIAANGWSAVMDRLAYMSDLSSDHLNDVTNPVVVEDMDWMNEILVDSHL